MAKSSLFPGWDEIDGSSISQEEIEAAYQEVMARASALEDYLKEQHRRQRVFWRRSLLAVAAAVALILVPLFSIRYARNAAAGGPEPVRYLQCATACGETRDVELPDHSHVTLNAQSVLIYPESFGEERRFAVRHGDADLRAAVERPAQDLGAGRPDPQHRRGRFGLCSCLPLV